MSVVSSSSVSFSFLDKIVPTNAPAIVENTVLVDKIDVLMEELMPLFPDLAAKNNPTEPENIPSYFHFNYPNINVFQESNQIAVNEHLKFIVKNNACLKNLELVYGETLREAIFRGYTQSVKALLNYYVKNVKCIITPFEQLQTYCFLALIDSKNHLTLFDFLKILKLITEKGFKMPYYLESDLYSKIMVLVKGINLHGIELNHEELNRKINIAVAEHLRARIATPTLALKC